MARSIWQFRGVGTEIEAFVLAEDYDHASELFQNHLRVNGGDPDTLLYREMELEHLDEDQASAILAALAIERDGLVTTDVIREWVFITPLGGRSNET